MERVGSGVHAGPPAVANLARGYNAAPPDDMREVNPDRTSTTARRAG
jgi:hypothetical protein